MCYSKKGFDNIREKLDDTKITDLIKQLKPKYSQEKMCKIFKISRATYYFNINKTTTKTQERYELLSSQIKRIYEENSKIYGAPKIHAILNREGYPASIKLVQRIMRALGLSSITRKKYKPQTIKSKVEAPASNLLKQDFSTTSINEKIVGDITYIYTKDFGWTYLASFMDLHTNEIKGWEYSTTMTTDIVLKALSKLNLNSDLTGCIIHTDQGSQYTSKDYVAKVKDLGATLSYSRKGNPYDNAPIESFHSVLKKELIYQSKPKTFEETKKSLFKYIEGWYNNHRIQKKLGYLSPADYQKQVA